MSYNRMRRVGQLLLGGTTLAAGYAAAQTLSSRSGAAVSVSADESRPSNSDQPLPTRQEQLKLLQETPEFDILVIGGGATGCGAALDAATRGLKTALVEKDDFSSGTSSRSTKLIHGGVRYLQKAIQGLDYEQYKLVREALHERANLLTIAPHLSEPLPIMLPVYRWWEVPYYYVGIKMYDWVSGKNLLKPSYYLPKTRAMEKFPMLKKEKLCGAIVYYDGQHNDARMNLAIGLTASRHGAVVTNHTEVLSLLKTTDEDGNERVCGAKARDCITGQEFDIRAKAVINATGPETDSIRLMGDPSAKKICQSSSGVHIVLPKYYSPDSMGLLDPATSDGRVIFFLPWMDKTLAGTTDNPCEVTHHPAPSHKEIDFILNEVRNYLSPNIKVQRGDVLAAWSGIRPLVTDPNAKNTESLSRNHVVDVAKNKLITIAGGKWTTYRSMAIDVVDAAINACGLTPERESQTDGLLLEGGHKWSPTYFIQLIQLYGLDDLIAKHLSNTYGDRADEVARVAEMTGKRWPVVGKRLAADFPYIEAEVRYAVKEYACTLVDVISRRTRLAFLNVKATEEALPKIADIMAQELKWSKAKKEEELKQAKTFLKVEMGGHAYRAWQEGEIKLSYTESEEYKKQFNQLDTDRTGYLTPGNIKRYLEGMGERVTNEELREMLDEVDCNQNGRVELEEFLALMSAVKSGHVTDSRLATAMELGKRRKMAAQAAEQRKAIPTVRSGGGV